MDITISLKDLGFIMIVTAAFILLVYLIVLTKHLIRVAKHTNKILMDVEVVSAITSDKVQEVDEILNNVGSTAGEISRLVDGNNSIFKALVNLVNMGAAVKGMFSMASASAAKATASASAANESETAEGGAEEKAENN